MLYSVFWGLKAEEGLSLCYEGFRDFGSATGVSFGCDSLMSCCKEEGFKVDDFEGWVGRVETEGGLFCYPVVDSFLKNETPEGRS